MAKKADNNSTSTRVFLVERILKQQTDKDHALTAEDIQKKLDDYGLRDVVCRTINNDVERIGYAYQLLEKNVPAIEGKYKRNYGEWQVSAIPKKGSFIKGQLFTDAELKLLYELIQSFHFLSLKEKETMIQKIYSNCSDAQIEKSRAYRSKTDKQQALRYIEGKDTMNNINKVLYAISKNCKIMFNYAHYRFEDDQVQLKNERKVVYPLELFINDGLVYMSAFPEWSRDKPRHYRLDKMSNVNSIKKNSDEDFEDQDLIMLSNKAHNHYDGFGNYEEEIKLELLVKSDVLDPLMERFNIYDGLEVTTNVGSDFNLKMVVDGVPTGDGLVKFLLGFRNNIKVIGPESLVNQITDIVDKTSNLYLKKND